MRTTSGPDGDQQRLMIKVARLYHTHGMRQTDIATRLQISQSRVSRLLTQAEETTLVRTIVAVPPHIHADLEESIEQKYGVTEVHVVDAVSDDEGELNRDLAFTMAALLGEVRFEAATIGFTSWSKTLRLMVDALTPLRTQSRYVVEMLGDLGPPELQHDAARSTQRLAGLAGAQPVFLRTPGVAASAEARDQILSRDVYAQRALEQLADIDLALVGIGASYRDPVLRPGDNFFDDATFALMRERGAVGEVCLHFLDSDGHLIDDVVDGRVIGVTADQLRHARNRWAVSGGPRKHAAVRAALVGGWIDTLVTDIGTAAYLLH